MTLLNDLLNAVRKKCIRCSAGSRKEVHLCPCDTSCPLWPYRSGRRPRKSDPKGYVEFKPRKKGTVWAIRNTDWAKVIYVFKDGESYVVHKERFRDLELAKGYARKKVGA